MGWRQVFLSCTAYLRFKGKPWKFLLLLEVLLDCYSLGIGMIFPPTILKIHAYILYIDIVQCIFI